MNSACVIGIPLRISILLSLHMVLLPYWWKPSTREPGVSKTDNKHYVYTLDYGQDMRETLKQDNVTVNQTQDKNVAAKLKEIKELYESGLISEEEYQTTRRKILDSYSE